MYQLKSEKANYVLNLPTDKNEITPEILTEITKNVNLSKHYAIIAIRYRVSPFELVMNGKSNSKNNVKVNVSTMLAKFNGDIEGNVGDKVLIAQTDLEMGLHINNLCKISVDNVRNYITSDDALNKSVINRTAFADTQYIYLLEFKIVSLNSIKAIVTEANGVAKDPFVMLNNE